jgi:OmpA-OmpF porin, OOP family
MKYFFYEFQLLLPYQDTFITQKKLIMKRLFLLLAVFTSASTLQAQILKNVANKAKQKVEQKADEKVGKSIDDATDGKKKTNTEEPTKESEETTNDNKSQTTSSAAPETLKAYSKYDFIQGEKVIAYEDFSNATVGDFPTRWNTNGTAEIVTLNKKEGKWLKIDKEGYFLPEFLTNIPENSTLEFDLGVNNDFSWYNGTMQFYITNLTDPTKFADGYWRDQHTIDIELHPNRDATDHSGRMWFRAGLNGNASISNDVPVKRWDVVKNNFAHISIWRQGQRLRIYINGEKLTDLPRGFDANAKYTGLVFNANSFHREATDYYLIGNIRLAVGAPDTRNKLITEGRFVTSGITFDVNSDKLKAESYGILKEIGAALKDNPEVKIRIIGHTDTDGDDAKNMDLSKRRAAAVKMSLATEFGIDESRMITDGLGETKPVADNKTAEGKAQNRRVEFIKQ